MGKSNTQIVTKETTPWAEQIPYLERAMEAAEGIYQADPIPEFYPGQTYAGFTDPQQEAFGMTGAYARGQGQDLVSRTQGGMANMVDQMNPMTNPYLDYSLTMAPGSAQTLRGMMQGGVNPYANQMVDAAMRRAGQGYEDLATARARAYADEIMPQLGQAQGLTQQAVREFQEGIAPQIRNTAISSGNFGSTRRGIAEGLAASRIGERLTDQLAGIEGQANLAAGRTMQDLIQSGTRQGQSMADLAANMYGGAFESGQQRALQAAQYGGQQLGQAWGGAQRSTLGAMGMAPEMYQLGLAPSQTLMGMGDRWQQMDQARIADAMKRYQFQQDAPWMQLGNLKNMIEGSYGGSTSMPYYSNPYGGALGGAAAGSSFGPWGALIGGALGYYASQ